MIPKALKRPKHTDHKKTCEK